MAPEHAVAVLDRLVHAVLPALDLEATPPFVYQLLLFACTPFGEVALFSSVCGVSLWRLRVCCRSLVSPLPLCASTIFTISMAVFFLWLGAGAVRRTWASLLRTRTSTACVCVCCAA